MKKSSQKVLDYNKRQRDNKDSAYHKNRARGSKGWTNGLLMDLHRALITKIFYKKLKDNEWHRRLSRLLYTVTSKEEFRKNKIRKINFNDGDKSYEIFKKRKKNSSNVWKDATNKEMLIECLMWRCQKLYVNQLVNNNKNIWEKRFNSLDSFNKNNEQR